MTSGEVTHRGLRDRPTHAWQSLGTKCLHITWGARGAINIAPLGLSAVTDPAEADFILAHGTEGVGLPDGDVRACAVEDMHALLRECAALGGRPMVIANPDLVTVDGCAPCSLPQDACTAADCCFENSHVRRYCICAWYCCPAVERFAHRNASRVTV